MNLTNQSAYSQPSNYVERFGEFLDATDNYFWEWVEWKNRTKSSQSYKEWFFEKLQGETPKITEGVHIEVKYTDFEILN